MRKNRRIVLALAALVCLAALMLGIWSAARPAPREGLKNITVTVVHGDGSEKEFTYRTEEAYLGDVLLEEGLIAREQGEFGLFVLTVDGETADYDRDGSWWCLTENGEQTTTGVSETAVTDGGRYGWTYTTG